MTTTRPPSVLEVTVPGVPAPQGSKSAVVRGRRAILLEGKGTVGREKHRAWRRAVWAAGLEQVRHDRRHRDPDVPLAVAVAFVLPRPKSRPLYLRWHPVKPDLDKLARSTLDGLADGQVIAADQQVAALLTVKRYEHRRATWTGAYVAIAELPHDDPAAAVAAYTRALEVVTDHADRQDHR